MVLGDGERVVLNRRRPDLEHPPGGHSLNPSGGSGSGGTSHYIMREAFWLWPLPPEGPIEVITQWPAFGIPETSIVLDSAPILELASSVPKLWPDHGAG